MGEVYRARDASLGRDLAIKILPPDLTRDPTRVERFMQEARAASALNHPHLTSIYEIGTEPGLAGASAAHRGRRGRRRRDRRGCLVHATAGPTRRRN